VQPGIARNDYPLLKDERVIGRVTSGTQSPSLGKAIALGYVSSDFAGLGGLVDVEIRGRKVPAKIVPLPFYRRNG
jgi:aminomethyltransferase